MDAIIDLMKKTADKECKNPKAAYPECVDCSRSGLCGPSSTAPSCYDPNSRKIYVCYDRLTDVELIDEYLKHEIVHAYDHCCRKDYFVPPKKGENVTSYCLHLACSEVRAYCFSGLCDHLLEGNERKECVKAHVIESLKNEPRCKGSAQAWAHQAVFGMYKGCYIEKGGTPGPPP